MLERLSVRGFKSLSDVDVELPRMAVLFGPTVPGRTIDRSRHSSRISELGCCAWKLAARRMRMGALVQGHQAMVV